MILNTTFDMGGLNLLKQKEEPVREHSSQANRLKQIEEAIDAASKEKKIKTIDEKVKKTKLPLKKSRLSEEEAAVYFSESNSKIDYDFSYLSNLKKQVFESYTGLITQQDKAELKTNYTEISHNMLEHIITVQKMDTLLGTKTGFIDQGTQERFNLLKKLSFYEAVIRVNYDLHT